MTKWKKNQILGSYNYCKEWVPNFMGDNLTYKFLKNPFSAIFIP